MTSPIVIKEVKHYEVGPEAGFDAAAGEVIKIAGSHPDWSVYLNHKQAQLPVRGNNTVGDIQTLWE